MAVTQAERQHMFTFTFAEIKSVTISCGYYYNILTLGTYNPE